MFYFTAQHRLSALVWLSLFHIQIITSSNYLVQLPISIFGFHTTWGAFTFPFIFLATDLTVRIFSAPDYSDGDGASAGVFLCGIAEILNNGYTICTENRESISHPVSIFLRFAWDH